MATRSKSSRRARVASAPRLGLTARRARVRDWPRRLGRALFPVAVLTVAGFIAYPFFLQLRLGGEYGARVSEARHKLEMLRRENTNLERDIRSLQSRIGLEKALREDGYGRTGEIGLKVHTATVERKSSQAQ